MSTKLEELAVELLGLPASSRAKLATQLIASLDESQAPDAEPLWLEEAQRRSAEISERKVECRTAEDVLRRAREALE